MFKHFDFKMHSVVKRKKRCLLLLLFLNSRLGRYLIQDLSTAYVLFVCIKKNCLLCLLASVSKWILVV